jgi:hypothetical protein
VVEFFLTVGHQGGENALSSCFIMLTSDFDCSNRLFECGLPLDLPSAKVRVCPNDDDFFILFMFKILFHFLFGCPVFVSGIESHAVFFSSKSSV